MLTLAACCAAAGSPAAATSRAIKVNFAIILLIEPTPLELDSDLQFGAVAGKFTEIERGVRHVDIVPDDLRIPGRGHEDLAIKLHVQGWPDIHSVACIRVEPHSIIVPQVPDRRINENGRHDTVGQL